MCQSQSVLNAVPAGSGYGTREKLMKNRLDELKHAASEANVTSEDVVYQKMVDLVVTKGELRYLVPNKAEFEYALVSKLAPCPFCGRKPVLQMKYRDDTEIFQAVITCGNCWGNIFTNCKDRDRARIEVIEKWENRKSPRKKKHVTPQDRE